MGLERQAQHLSSIRGSFCVFLTYTTLLKTNKNRNSLPPPHRHQIKHLMSALVQSPCLTWLSDGRQHLVLLDVA